MSVGDPNRSDEQRDINLGHDSGQLTHPGASAVGKLILVVYGGYGVHVTDVPEEDHKSRKIGRNWLPQNQPVLTVRGYCDAIALQLKYFCRR